MMQILVGVVIYGGSQVFQIATRAPLLTPLFDELLGHRLLQLAQHSAAEEVIEPVHRGIEPTLLYLILEAVSTIRMVYGQNVCNRDQINVPEFAFRSVLGRNILG